MRVLAFFFLASSDNHRAAFVALIALVVAAGIPLAFAWARLLPEDAPPFKIEAGSYQSVEMEPTPEPAKKSRRDLLSIALLLCVTATYLVRFPGIPLPPIAGSLGGLFSNAVAPWIFLSARVVLLVGTGLGACYAALRPGPQRVPMVLAAGFALILWLLGPILQSAMLSP
jgi:hypothetical protein